jgi:hypothetical protein
MTIAVKIIVADDDVAMHDHRSAKLPEPVDERIVGAGAGRNVRVKYIRGGHRDWDTKADADRDAGRGEEGATARTNVQYSNRKPNLAKIG